MPPKRLVCFECNLTCGTARMTASPITSYIRRYGCMFGGRSFLPLHLSPRPGLSKRIQTVRISCCTEAFRWHRVWCDSVMMLHAYKGCALNTIGFHILGLLLIYLSLPCSSKSHSAPFVLCDSFSFHRLLPTRRFVFPASVHPRSRQSSLVTPAATPNHPNHPDVQPYIHSATASSHLQPCLHSLRTSPP